MTKILTELYFNDFLRKMFGIDENLVINMKRSTGRTLCFYQGMVVDNIQDFPMIKEEKLKTEVRILNDLGIEIIY